MAQPSTVKLSSQGQGCSAGVWRPSSTCGAIDKEFTALDDLLILDHRPLWKNEPGVLTHQQRANDNLVTVGILGGNRTHTIQITPERSGEQTVVGEGHYRSAGEPVYLIRKNQGFQAGEMIYCKDRHPIRDIISAMNPHRGFKQPL